MLNRLADLFGSLILIVVALFMEEEEGGEQPMARPDTS